MFGRKSDAGICPLLKTACIEAQCMWWTQVRGTSPQGGEIDYPDCAVRWLPVLLIEGAKVGRETGAAVESLRNETVRSTRQVARSVLLAAQAAAPVRTAERITEERASLG
jgi:hypothetical protein